jgi:predicted transcriptional regulator
LTGVEELKKARRRERARIYYDILCSIKEQELSGDARITKVQNDVNLPSDRLRLHLREMNRLGLVVYGEALASTEKGKRFLSEYEKVVEVLREFGLL